MASERVLGLQINGDSTMAPVALLFYDYLLTLADEIKFFWVPRPSWPTITFLANRYVSLLGHIPIILQTLSPLSPQQCHGISLYHGVLSIIIQILVAFLMMFRLYALYDQPRIMFIIFVALTVTLVPLAFWSIIDGSAGKKSITAATALGCSFQPLTEEMAKKTCIAWAALLAFDTAAFILTVYKTSAYRTLGPLSLPTLILRDGAIYYVAMGLANLANIFTLLYGSPTIKPIFSTGANILSTVIMSRMMLHLHSPDILRRRRREASDVLSRTSLRGSDSDESSAEAGPALSTVPALTIVSGPDATFA